jgi:hypothetical protein
LKPLTSPFPLSKHQIYRNLLVGEYDANAISTRAADKENTNSISKKTSDNTKLTPLLEVHNHQVLCPRAQ